jgi:monoamine oxidase
VAVVGAGLAGLTAAFRLQQAGVDVALFEANADRVGGRCWTERSFFAGGLTAEHGPERIGTEHVEIRALADELELELHDHLAGQDTVALDMAEKLAPAGAEGPSPETLFYDAVRTDLARRGIAVGRPRRDGQMSEAEVALDAMSIREWIDETLDGGMASTAGHVVGSWIAMGTGRSIDELSAYTLTRYAMSAEDDPDNAEHNRYQVRGGNSSIPEAMRARLAPGVLTLGAKLTRVARVADDGGYRLEFSSGHSVTARAVIFALPFTALRHADLTDAGLSDTKRAAIDEFDLGVLTKVSLQFDRPRRDFPDWDGLVINDDPMMYALCTSGGQDVQSMVIATFYGGDDARALSNGVAHAPAPEAVVTPVLDVLDAAVPGLRDAFTGLAWMDSWCDDENTFGAYSSFQPGQIARFAHAVATPEGGLFFAGEHTSTEHQSSMNGAVESGQRAAREALAYLT